MNKIIIFLFAFIFISCGDSISKKKYEDPKTTFAAFFEEVQLKRLFEHDKVFADAIPKYKAELILEKYQAEKEGKGFDLKSFITQNFLIEKQDSLNQAKPNLSLEKFIPLQWEQLKTNPKDDGGSLIPTRKPYIATHYTSKEFNYSNSYFSVLALLSAKNDTLAENIVLNFIQLIQDFGHVPLSNRSYSIGGSQSPYLSLMLEEIGKKKPEILSQSVAQLTKDYQYWMSAENKEQALALAEAQKKGEKVFDKLVILDNDNLLNRYYSFDNTPRSDFYSEDKITAEKNIKDTLFYRNTRAVYASGWEKSNRFSNENYPISNFTSIELNALLYHYETTLANIYLKLEKPQYAESFSKLAEKRKKAFNKYFWDESKGFFFDFNFVKKQKSNYYSLGAVLPLYVGLADKNQAKKIAENLEKLFLKKGGLVDGIENNSLGNFGSPQFQYFAVKAMEKYGYSELSKTISDRFLSTVESYYLSSGLLLEKYDVHNQNQKFSYPQKIDATLAVAYLFLRK
jgi:alpha,alpha-trehalase